VPENEGAGAASGSSRTIPTGSTADAHPRSFNAFMIVLAIFALGNSTDAFLLLRLTRRQPALCSADVGRAPRDLGALAARVLFGAVWSWFGARAAFGVGATLALATTALLFVAL
jgi:hypothetical protein